MSTPNQTTPPNAATRIGNLLIDVVHLLKTHELRMDGLDTQLLYLMGPRTAATTEKFIADLELHKARMEAHGAEASPPALATPQPKTRIQ